MGVIHSFLLPTDKAFPMVAAKDVGLVAAKLIQEDWSAPVLWSSKAQAAYRRTTSLAPSHAWSGRPVSAVTVAVRDLG